MNRLSLLVSSLALSASAAFAGQTTVDCVSLGKGPQQIPASPGQVPVYAQQTYGHTLSIGQRAQQLGAALLGGAPENNVWVGRYLIAASGPLDQTALALRTAILSVGTPQFPHNKQKACASKAQVASSLQQAHVYFHLPPVDNSIVTEDILKGLRCELEELATNVGCGYLFLQN